MKLPCSRSLVVGALALALFVTGCGDDDDSSPASSGAPSTAPDEGADSADAVEVTAVDYAFEGLPETLQAGTKLTLKNDSEKELHELVAFVLPDDEQRSADELMKLPQEELEGLFPPGPPATVLMAPPGSGEQIEAVGDGTLTEPGRYLVICAIPTGADPEALLDPANQTADGPPDVPGGPPHFTQGMYAEVTVQ